MKDGTTYLKILGEPERRLPQEDAFLSISKSGPGTCSNPRGDRKRHRDFVGIWRFFITSKAPPASRRNLTQPVNLGCQYSESDFATSQARAASRTAWIQNGMPSGDHEFTLLGGHLDTIELQREAVAKASEPTNLITTLALKAEAVLGHFWLRRKIADRVWLAIQGSQRDWARTISHERC